MKSKFDFRDIQREVYALKFAQDKADYLETVFMEVSEYVAAAPDEARFHRPLLNMLKEKIAHYHTQAIEELRSGIQLPYVPSGKGRPRKEPVEQRTDSDQSSQSDLIKPSDAASDVLTAKQAAKYLGMAVSTIHTYKSKGRIPSRETATGGTIYLRSELDDYRSGKWKPEEKRFADDDERLSEIERNQRKRFRPSRELKKLERQSDPAKMTFLEARDAYHSRRKG